MNIINMTPHVVSIVGYGVITTFPPEGNVARVEVTREDAGEISGIKCIKSVMGEVINLPEPEEGKFFIVSRIVFEALPSRSDLLVPDQLVRDDEGRIIGCEGFCIR